MNPIFKISNGIYVDLSRIIAIRMEVLHNDRHRSVCGQINIQYEKIPEQMLWNPSVSDFGQVKIRVDIQSIYPGGYWTFEDLYLGSMDKDYKRIGGNPEAAIEDFRVKFEAKYQYVIDAWTEYKLYIECSRLKH